MKICWAISQSQMLLPTPEICPPLLHFSTLSRVREGRLSSLMFVVVSHFMSIYIVTVFLHFTVVLCATCLAFSISSCFPGCCRFLSSCSLLSLFFVVSHVFFVFMLLSFMMLSGCHHLNLMSFSHFIVVLCSFPCIVSFMRFFSFTFDVVLYSLFFILWRS